MGERRRNRFEMAQEESTVLLVARGERMADALEQALARRGLLVERASPERLVATTFVMAPDLVVLAGDLARDGGRYALTLLKEKPTTASVPVVLVSESASLGQRLEAFRHGVVAVVPRSASADDTAKRIAEIAADVPDRPGESRGVAEASVDELVDLFASELRSGILSVAAGSDDVSAQVVLHAGRPVKEAIEELVAKLKPLVQRAKGPLSYEFFEQASSRLGSLDLDLESDAALEVFDGLRVVLIEQRAARSDVLAQELRGVGAEVVVADGAGVGLERARWLDPSVVILDGSDVDGWALGAVRALRRDPHLRWASLLVVDESQLWTSESRPDLAVLATAVGPLVELDREIAARVNRGRAFDVRIETVGPFRLLRAVAETGRGLRLRLTHSKLVTEIDLAEGLIAGASARTSAVQRVEGPAALATFCAVSAGRVRIEPKEAPATTNVMAPLSSALAAADAERPMLAPSVPPPSDPPSEAPAQGAEGGGDSDQARLMLMLEALVAKLDRVMVDRRAATDEPSGSAPSAPVHAAPANREGVESGDTGQGAAPRASVAPRQVSPSDSASPSDRTPAATSSLAGGLGTESPASDGRDSTFGTPDKWPGAGDPPTRAPGMQPRRPLLPRLPVLAAVAGATLLWATCLLTSVLLWVTSAAPDDEVEKAGGSRSGEGSAGRFGERTVPATREALAPSPSPEPSTGPSPEPQVLGPRPEEPLEGIEADFDLSAYGVEPAPPPNSRRRRAVLVQELIRQANVLRNREQLSDAQELYQRVLSLDPENPRATAGMIRIFMAREEAAHAIAFARRLVRLRPELASNWVLLGDTFEMGHNSDAALRAWTHALELHPSWRPALDRIRRIGRTPPG